MPQFPAPRDLSVDQLEAIKSLIPEPGDPPAVQAQKQAALIKVLETLGGAPGASGGPGARQGVRPSTAFPTNLTDEPPPAPGEPEEPPALFGGGRSRGAGVTFSWRDRIDDAVDTAAAQQAEAPTLPPAAPPPAPRPAPAPPLDAPPARPTGPTTPAPGRPPVAPIGATPMRGTGYGTAALSGIDAARAAADSPNGGAAFSADPRRPRTTDARVNAAVEEAMATLLTDPPQTRPLGRVTDASGRDLEVGRARKPTSLTGPPNVPGPGSAASGSLNLSDYTRPAEPPHALAPGGRGGGTLGRATPLPAAAAAALASGPPPSPPMPPGASLNLADYTGPGRNKFAYGFDNAPAEPPGVRTSPYGFDPDEREPAFGGQGPGGAAPGAAPTPGPRAAGGVARPAAKAPPAPARASVPRDYLGPDVEAQTKATFARQAPPTTMGRGPTETGASALAQPIGTLPPAQQKAEILKLLSQADVSSQVGGPPVDLGSAPPPETRPSLSAAVDPEVTAMVEQLLAEARQSAPPRDAFRKRRAGPQAYFGRK